MEERVYQTDIPNVDELKHRLIQYWCNLDLCDLGYRFFFTQRSMNRWNSLTQEEVNAPSVNSFKNHLEKRRKRKIDFFMDCDTTNNWFSSPKAARS